MIFKIPSTPNHSVVHSMSSDRIYLIYISISDIGWWIRSILRLLSPWLFLGSPLTGMQSLVLNNRSEKTWFETKTWAWESCLSGWMPHFLFCIQEKVEVGMKSSLAILPMAVTSCNLFSWWGPMAFNRWDQGSQPPAQSGPVDNSFTLRLWVFCDSRLNQDCDSL